MRRRGSVRSRRGFVAAALFCAMLAASSGARAATGTGSIGGTISDSSGAPLWSFCVTAYDLSGNYVGDDYANDNGRYAILGLAAGTYKVQFQDCADGTYADEWYNDKRDFDSADPVSVTDGKRTANISASMALSASLFGSIHDEDTQASLENICVMAWDQNQILQGTAGTDEDGFYELDGLHAGIYKVEFSDCNDGTHRGGWYDHKTSYAGADPVTLHEGDYVEVDTVLNTCLSEADSDGDGLSDCDELYNTHTDPHDADTDGDLFSDGYEINGGTCIGQTTSGGSDPRNPFSTPLVAIPADPPAARLTPAGTAPLCN